MALKCEGPRVRILQTPVNFPLDSPLMAAASLLRNDEHFRSINEGSKRVKDKSPVLRVPLWYYVKLLLDHLHNHVACILYSTLDFLFHNIHIQYSIMFISHPHGTSRCNSPSVREYPVFPNFRYNLASRWWARSLHVC